MEKSILIIDDEAIQAKTLAKSLKQFLPDYTFEDYSSKNEILNAIENRFYNLAIIDIRMDKLGISGLEIANKIFEINPIAKVILISAYKEEYFESLKNILKTGKVLDVLSKSEKPSDSAEIIVKLIQIFYKTYEADLSLYNASLLQFYSETKNELDTYKKGVQFERFISLLFGSMGYKEINRRIIDVSRNEIDLSIRNEIRDPFLNKFGKYILVECKNKPDYKVGKNDFIVFNDKLKNSNGLAELGIIATTGGFAKTTYLQAMRESGSSNKILFLSNVEFIELIQAENKIERFKKIIDEQMKSN